MVCECQRKSIGRIDAWLMSSSALLRAIHNGNFRFPIELSANILCPASFDDRVIRTLLYKCFDLFCVFCFVVVGQKRTYPKRNDTPRNVLIVEFQTKKVRNIFCAVFIWLMSNLFMLYLCLHARILHRLNSCQFRSEKTNKTKTKYEFMYVG